MNEWNPIAASRRARTLSAVRGALSPAAAGRVFYDPESLPPAWGGPPAGGSSGYGVPIKNKDADEAFLYAIIGIFCFGIVLEPFAIYKAIQAKKKIAMNPALPGGGKATAALIIASIGLLLWLFGLVARIGGAMRGGM